MKSNKYRELLFEHGKCKAYLEEKGLSERASSIIKFGEDDQGYPSGSDKIWKAH